MSKETKDFLFSIMCAVIICGLLLWMSLGLDAVQR